jgi:DNA-binding MarR family transcriptional regulator
VHPIFQSFKRAYWSSMRFSRAWMSVYRQEYRVTPARLDMLIIVGRDRAGVAQNVLRQTLDVCDSVVSRMLDSLEELGYVVRARCPHDRRVNWLQLTERGHEILEEMTRKLLHDGFTEHCVRDILSADPTDNPLTERMLARTRRFLLHVRRRVVDRSTMVYPAYLADGDRDPAYPYRRGDHVYDPSRRRPPRPAARSSSAA